MEQELLILGLLKQGPKHPYQIKRLMQDVLSTFAPLENVSLYYPLRQMEKKGLVVKEAKRLSRRPQRYVYSITQQGQSEFRRLLDRSFLTVKRPYFNIDLALYFMPFVKQSVVHKRLRARFRILKRIKADLKKLFKSLNTKKSYHLALILEHNLELVGAEMKFLDKLIDFLE